MKRWFCVELKKNGIVYFVGRVYATAAEVRRDLGPYAEVNDTNGHVLIWGMPRGRA